MATPLYDKIINFKYSRPGASEEVKQQWEATPYVVDAHTGSMLDGSYFDVLHWCREQWGQQYSDIHGNAGHWQTGGASINGWTFMGFDTSDKMETFKQRYECRD